MFYDIITLDPVNNFTLFTNQQLNKLKETMTSEKLKGYQQVMEYLFEQPLVSVVTKKHSPFEDLHEYVSFATYWWPNPETKDGLPYIRKDGYANPVGKEYDKDKLRATAILTYHSALLYYLTNDKRYYELLKKHVRYFFLDEKTKMNPSMEGGQFIPGVNNGRAEGIIDYAANFTYALNLLMQLDQEDLLEKNLVSDLKTWHKDFLNWLLTSKIGKKELTAMNNHGTFYDLAVVTIARFVNDDQVVSMFKEGFIQRRVEPQIDASGLLPKEIARTKSLSYSLMGLKGLIELSESYQINAPQIDQAINKIISLKDHWPYEQVTTFDPGIWLQYQFLLNNYQTKWTNFKVDVSEKEVINKPLYYLYSK
jgi:hypothetical protein